MSDRFLRGAGHPCPARVFVLLLVIAGIVGCGDGRGSRVATIPVEGTITYRGQPIPGAFVTLHPKFPRPDVPASRASVGRDGTLTVSTFTGGDGAPEGEYVLTVEWYRPVRQGNDVVPGPNVIPKKYASRRTSDLVVRVAPDAGRLPPIAL